MGGRIWWLSAALAVGAAAFVGTTYLMDNSSVTTNTASTSGSSGAPALGSANKPSASMIEDLAKCRAAKQPDCAKIAGPLAKAMLAGDTAWAEASEKGVFGVYLSGDKVTYVKANCTSDDLKIDLFSLNAFAQNVNALPEDRRQYGFQSLDFLFSDTGYRIENMCIAVVALPFGRASRIITGQYKLPEGAVWTVDLSKK